MSRSTELGKLPAAVLDEGRARALCLLRACEEGPVNAALWSPEDAVWASRLADETVDQIVDQRHGASASHAFPAGRPAPAATPASAPPALWLAERARHARERLLPRHAVLARVYTRRTWSLRWVLGAAAAGFIVGLLGDLLSGTQHIDLLAAPVWAVVLWNLGVYVWIAVRAEPGRPPGPARRRAAAADEAPERRFERLWAETSAPLAAGRAALLLHVAAAALALGLVAGLYGRALVLDYRPSWQSTLLEAPQVHGVLSVLLAPASALTGLAVPDAATVAALRVDAGGAAVVQAAPAQRPPALPWLHLLAATLAWAVVVPRFGLAMRAAWATALRARHLPVVVDDAHSLRLLQMRRRGAVAAAAGGVQVLPHGFVPAPAAALALSALLRECLGPGVALSVAASTPYGEEERAPGPAAQPAAGQGESAGLRIAWFELAATPEPQVQGRFVEQLRTRQGARRLLALVDEAGYRQRMGAASPRLRERRALWQQWGEAVGVGVACIDLLALAADIADAAALTAARVEFEAALEIRPHAAPAAAAPGWATDGRDDAARGRPQPRP